MQLTNDLIKKTNIIADGITVEFTMVTDIGITSQKFIFSQYNVNTNSGILWSDKNSSFYLAAAFAYYQ